MSTEEDTYNIIFKAMQHPIRRRILRNLNENPITYTEIQRDLNIDNGLLNYHLDAMNSLITKNNEEKYTLSEFGRATVNLVRGVEEPIRTSSAKTTSTHPAIKALIAVLAIALVISTVGLIDLNNRYLDLSGRYSAQSAEKTYLQSALATAEASQNRLNSTLTALEKNPLVKAATMIINRVGIDYFNKYFHDPSVKTDVNFTVVVYKHRIQVGEYIVDHNVTFYFGQKWIMLYGGIPTQDNLQPFKVSEADAKKLAIDAGLPDSLYALEAKIVGAFNIDLFPQPLYADKYVWKVTSYADPPWARMRTYTYAIVDPVTGEVYKTNGRGGIGLSESQVDTAEEAAAHGINYYVKLEYPELPQPIQIAKGDNYTFTIRATLISYNSSLQEVKINVDPLYVDPYRPLYVDPYRIQPRGTVDKLSPVLFYEPCGVISMRAGESVNIKATVRVPDDAGEVFFFSRYYLDSLGIGAEGVLILSDLEA